MIQHVGVLFRARRTTVLNWIKPPPETYQQVRETVSRVGEEAKQTISGSTGQSSGANPVREASPRADDEGKFS
jgi:hypothetical protein